MNKKIAIFANSWSNDILSSFLKGYTEAVKGKAIDTFFFLAANSYGRPESNNISEMSIHEFPDLNDFDLAIVFSQGLNSSAIREKIYENCEKAGILTICIGDNHPGFYGILVKNGVAMKELCEHLYSKHNVRKVVFFGGPADNGDSNKRLQAVKEFAEEHEDFVLPEDEIYYTDWESDIAMDIIHHKYTTKESLPDAMIFANDFLAISSTMALEQWGIECPRDVLVTGFDFVKAGQTYFPSIATIDQRYDKIGMLCIQLALDLFDNKEVPRESYIDGEFKPGESCGCENPRNEDEMRRLFCHALIGKQYETATRKGLIYDIRAAFQESSRFSTLPEKLREAIYQTGHPDIQTVYIMIDPMIERIAHEEVEKLPVAKYSDKMQVVVARKNGVGIKTDYMMPKKQVIPEYNGTEEGEIYFLMPLFIDSFVVGYFVMVYTESGVRDWVYWEYESCITQSLSHYKTNIRLTALNDKLSELMQTDALTSLKNRTAYENEKSKLKSRYLAQDGTRFAAVMFDLNNLKKINDAYGHGAGDIYIKNSSELICNTFKHSPVFRVGGDEFVAIVKNSDYDERYELLEKFRSEVARLQNEPIPDLSKVSVASGMADFEEIEYDDIETIFKKADDRMYENKRLMKAQRV
ncbi:MAG: GGDEF domain-containing protein [Lachnospiraceae bacterium]|nr:GGDEF domain-containing protein [Lachnospiraceae bacterium]